MMSRARVRNTSVGTSQIFHRLLQSGSRAGVNGFATKEAFYGMLGYPRFRAKRFPLRQCGSVS
jgi:hypothetical protein